jgi:hypothetical protein
MPVKLGRWAWLATGYVSKEEMASFWHRDMQNGGLRSREVRMGL